MDNEGLQMFRDDLNSLDLTAFVLMVNESMLLVNGNVLTWEDNEHEMRSFL